METGQIKTINDYQQQVYSDFEKDTTRDLLEKYEAILHEAKRRETLKILDIGGGAGFFALALCDFFSDIT